MQRHTQQAPASCTTFSVLCNPFKELFLNSLTGGFPKSECKGNENFNTIQIFLQLFYEKFSELILIKTKAVYTYDLCQHFMLTPYYIYSKYHLGVSKNN